MKSKTYSYKVPNDLVGKFRLSEYLKGLFPYLETGSAVKKAIQRNMIKLNDKIGKSGDWVSGGNQITYEFTYEKVEMDDVSVDTFYEDRDLLVVRKPPGISTSGKSRSFQHHLHNLEIEEYDGSLPYPYLVHRLDRATEGLLIAAKNINTRRLLAQMMETHSIIKDYVLIIKGVIEESLKWIATDIDNKPAKTEILKSVVLNTKDISSIVYVRLHSGRTHQIRKHFIEMGHPIVGDNIYNPGGLTFGTGLLLCAYRLEFIHPISQKIIKVEYPIPTKIGKYKHKL